MKDPSRQPTNLEKLLELIERVEASADVEMEPVHEWLTWTYNFLSARKMYHKKTAIKTAILKRMAETLLSKDELEAIDRQAEVTLGSLETDTIKPEGEPDMERDRR